MENPTPFITYVHIKQHVRHIYVQQLLTASVNCCDEAVVFIFNYTVFFSLESLPYISLLFTFNRIQKDPIQRILSQLQLYYK